jgi:diadenosine tetraphosphate (Ap4A) HIT family hydrolase
MTCPLCVPVAETVLWQDEACRVIAVDDPALPGFCRVVWSAHVAEMSDLLAAEQRHLLAVVLATEKALRSLMQPDKMNLASLGNVVPHLHWHVIPRFRDDANFPDPIWSPARREGVRRSAPPVELLAQAIESSLRDG